jgi:diadenosine tetraphosphatase ApaH/serine/threonine PP2A family protein phosphatase
VHSNGHGKSKDWSAKFIGGLWEHLKHLWQFRNDIYHQDNEGTIAQYKLEALEREMEKLWTHHTELLPKLWDFQKQHFDRRQRILDLRYESKKCWATLTKLYLDDAETNRPGINSGIEQTLGWRT